MPSATESVSRWAEAAAGIAIQQLVKLSPARVCSHEDGKDHPFYSYLPY